MAIKKLIAYLDGKGDQFLWRANITFIVLEVLVIFLVGVEILALDYSFAGTANRTGLKGCIGIQVLVLFLIAQYQDGIDKTTLLRGMLFFGLIVLLWVALELSIDTSFRGFSHDSVMGRILNFFDR